MYDDINHEATVARLRDKLNVLEDLVLFLAEQRGLMTVRLAEIANHATVLAISANMSKKHIEDLSRISHGATEIMSHIRAECDEIDRALMFVSDKPKPASVCANYIFPAVRSQYQGQV
ncbi:MAG TPA: hypothetical protein VMJ11_05095 [Paraburkholderia sp.]|uniref:hypothetical protein n=1 Tax=Paraburkholderia sp. TaxID=1926495 RepID=UPI002C39A596|nr:hypothetical protein [Paraburkholderia sp.]HTR06031.1 hypothetical protein [Paraburkholderia sp.]